MSRAGAPFSSRFSTAIAHLGLSVSPMRRAAFRGRLMEVQVVPVVRAASRAVAGMVVGSLVRVLRPVLALSRAEGALAHVLSAEPLGLAWLRPAALTSFSDYPLVGGVALSLGANLLAFIAFSLTRLAAPLERPQATAFIGDIPSGSLTRFGSGASATVGEIEAMLARYLGAQRARRARSR
jgi:hypothetical protein